MAIHFTLAIPTKDRRIDLTRLLKSIQNQKRLPDDIIIVDGSDNSIEDLIKEFTKLPLRYFRCRPPSLPKQRNVAISELKPETNWIGFLDDDLELLPETLLNLENFILQKQITDGGLGLTILNQPVSQNNFLNSFFLLDKDQGGKITKSGYPSNIRIYDQPYKVDWLYGGATFWSKKTLQDFKFDEWFSGTGYMEDIDFSFRVSLSYPLWICPAPCYHFSHPIRAEKQFIIGVWQICSFWYFIKKNIKGSRLLAFWSCLGLCFKSGMLSLLQLDTASAKRFMGNIFGIIKVLTFSYKTPIIFYK